MNFLKQGLVATIQPDYLVKLSPNFGSFTNCFTFMQGFDVNFVSRLGVKTLRPEDLGWLHFTTKEQWKQAVSKHFDPAGIPAQKGTLADREGNELNPNINTSITHNLCHLGLNFDGNYVLAICFPKIEGALDYHFAVFNGNYWLEQAGHGGPLNIWNDENYMLNDVYNRKDRNGNLFYVPESAFIFKKRID